MAEAENPKKIIPEFIERAIKREIEIVIVEELEKAQKRIEERKSHVVANVMLQIKKTVDIETLGSTIRFSIKIEN
jgi:hypothetical protein